MTATTVTTTRRSPRETAADAGTGVIVLAAVLVYAALWLVEANLLADTAWGYTVNPWPWLVAHIVLGSMALTAMVMATRSPDDDLDTPASRRLGRTVFFGVLLLFVLPALFSLASSALADDGDGGTAGDDPARLIADLVENACPNGVDDTTNWPEQADTDFALAAGPSLLGQTPSEILSSWYGEEGRGCSQASKELQATAALRAADVGLDDGQFINQLRPRFLNESNLWEDSVDATAPIFSNLLANEYREEVVFKDRDAYCVTVLNDHTVTQMKAVFVNPVSGFEGLPSLPESVEEGPHVWYLPAYDIFCREAPFERVPVTEGVVELGKEAEEERVATEEEVAEATSDTVASTEDTISPSPSNEGTQGGDSGDKVGEGDDEGTTGKPGSGGECEGTPTCSGENDGEGGSGGEDCQKDCEGNGGGNGGECKDCPPDTAPPTTEGPCDCPPETVPKTTTTTVPRSTTTSSTTSTTTSTTTSSTSTTSTTTTIPTTTTTMVPQTPNWSTSLVCVDDDDGEPRYILEIIVTKSAPGLSFSPSDGSVWLADDVGTNGFSVVVTAVWSTGSNQKIASYSGQCGKIGGGPPPPP